MIPQTLTRPKASARAASPGSSARISEEPTRKASAKGASRSTSARLRNARFGDDQGPRRHQRGKPLGRGEVDLQRVEVAVVDPDDLGAEPDRPAHLLGVVGLDQHVHAEPPGRRHHRRRFVVVEHGEDDEHRVGAVKPGFGHLARIDDEVLGQDRPEELAPDRPQILQRTRRNRARR